MGKRSNGTRSGGGSEATAARTLSTTAIGGKETSQNTFTASDGNKYEYGKFFSVETEKKVNTDLKDMVNAAGIKKISAIGDVGVKYDAFYQSYGKAKKKDQHIVDEYEYASRHTRTLGWDGLEEKKKKLDGLLTQPMLGICTTNKKFDNSTQKYIRSAHEVHNIKVSYDKQWDNYIYKDTVQRWGKSGNYLGEKRIQKGLSKKQIIQRLKKFSGEEWRDYR